MKRIPVIATLVVALAITAMIALGIWQLQRKAEKEALLVRYAANRTLSPVPFPATPDASALFRRSFVACRGVIGWQEQGGRDAAGRSGWRQIATCRTDVPGVTRTIQAGVAPGPGRSPKWRGGMVIGYITHAPDHRPLIAGLVDHRPQPLMLVADRPAPGLAANPAPDLSAIPNNHLAYAVQWFLFAGIAMVIYALALRRRLRAQAVGGGTAA